MKAMAIAILTPIFSGLLLAASGMYIDVQELKAKEPLRQNQLDRIEVKLDTITDYLMNTKSVIIKKRGK